MVNLNHQLVGLRDSGLEKHTSRCICKGISREDALGGLWLKKWATGGKPLEVTSWLWGFLFFFFTFFLP